MEFLKLLAESTKTRLPNDEIKLFNIDANQILIYVLNIIYAIGGFVAIIVIIIAGYSFITSVYDQAKITQAKNAILYAVVGLVVIVCAFVITNFVLNKF